MRLVAYGHRITARRRLPNNLGWQVRLAGGQIVTIFDTGSLLVQGANREPVKWLLQHFDLTRFPYAPLSSPQDRIRSESPEPDQRSPGESARFDPTASYIDADGRPIPLPGTDEILALAPPPLPPKVWENPKTLQHLLNRLRALGYSIRFDKARGGGEWQIELKTGQTIYYREGGRIRLGERDHRLERLFKIESESTY
jgi:hypothetical protein